jgi:hypothetical protein
MRLIVIVFAVVIVAVAAGAASFFTYVEAVMVPGPPSSANWDSAWTDQGLIVGSVAALLVAGVLILLIRWIARRRASGAGVRMPGDYLRS